MVLFNGQFIPSLQNAARHAVASHERIVYGRRCDGAPDVRRRRSVVSGTLCHPGLTDAHLHFRWYAIGFSRLTRKRRRWMKRWRASERATLRATPPGMISAVDGITMYGAVLPTAADLDRAAPAARCAVGQERSRAVGQLARAGISRHHRVHADRRRQIVRDARGQPTGMLLEDAMDWSPRSGRRLRRSRWPS
jgi:predicted amidohydrolase YtcJ